MNIAILLTGNIRTLDLCKQNTLNAFKFLSPDYFVSTYNASHQYHYLVKNAINFNNDSILTDIQIEEKFLDFYPKSILIDDILYAKNVYETESKKFNKNMIFDASSHFLQFWKIKRGLDLIQQYEIDNNISYDIIIKTRTDLIYKDLSCIDFANINEKVVVCNGAVELNDQVIISTKQNMINVINSMLNEFYNYTSEYSKINPPHGLLKYSIDKNNLKPDIQPLLEYIQRENGIRSYL